MKVCAAQAPAYAPSHARSSPSQHRVFNEGWKSHERRLLDVIRPLTVEQLQLRPAPEHWAVWQLASNMVGGRAYWLHDILGEGDPAVRDMFRVASTTVPDLPLADAGWEDDEDHPRNATELANAFAAIRGMIDKCLERWTEEDLLVSTHGDAARSHEVHPRLGHLAHHGA